MRFLLISMGSDGDVFPFIAVAACLRKRGHDVALVANAGYAGLADRHDLEFHALVSNEDTGRLLADPNLWRPLRSALHGARWGRRLIGPQADLLLRLVQERPSVLVATPPVFAARMVQERTAAPLVSLVSMPWMLLSDHAPPRMALPFPQPRWKPRLLETLQWRLAEGVADFLVGREVNRVRRQWGRPPRRRIVRWAYSPSRTIGLFPSWYAPPQIDWPPDTRLAGFPMYDARDSAELPAEVRRFCEAGPPPIAFTFGTGMLHGARKFAAAIDACTRMGRRGLLITRHRDQVPARLPGHIAHVSFAPFGLLFPRCAAVVHHGGIGTTSQALAAGLPQLVLPMAWDQPDNADRIQRLRVGRALPHNARGHRLARALSELSHPAIGERCRDIARRLDQADRDPLNTAADWIEGVTDLALPARQA